MCSAKRRGRRHVRYVDSSWSVAGQGDRFVEGRMSHLQRPADADDGTGRSGEAVAGVRFKPGNRLRVASDIRSMRPDI